MSDKNIIELKFDKSTTRLAGNPYGLSVYNEQVKEKIDFNKLNIIIFPDNIEKAASSFVQGFFAEIVKEIGYSKINEKVEIKTVHEKLRENIYKDLI